MTGILKIEWFPCKLIVIRLHPCSWEAITEKQEEAKLTSKASKVMVIQSLARLFATCTHPTRHVFLEAATRTSEQSRFLFLGFEGSPKLNLR
jgi:hypothetical protein